MKALLSAVGAAVGYFVAARVGYLFAIPGGIVTVWPPAGLMLGVLTLTPPRRWPPLVLGALVGSFASDTLTGLTVGVTLWAGLANLTESMAAAWLLRRFGGPAFTLSSLRNVLLFVAGAVVISNGVTAALGAAALKGPFFRRWLTWWVGDGLGMLIVAPVVLAAVAAIRHQPRVRFWPAVEAAAIVTALGVTAGIALGPFHEALPDVGPYVVFPLLFWAGLRLGPSGAAMGLAIVAAITVASASDAHGPFAAAGEHVALAIQTYAYLFVASLASLVPAAVLEEREVARRAVDESERRYRNLFESNPQPTWVYDVETLAFLAVNNAAIARYGYSRDEFLRMTILDIRHPDEVPRLRSWLQTIGPRPLERTTWRHQTKDGTLIDVAVNSHSIEFAGRRARVVQAVDLTEQRRAEASLQQVERQLRQSQKLEAVGRLAGGVAHDFNNLLTVILGEAELLLDGVAKHDARREPLQAIHDAANRAALLTRQLLTFSRRQVVALAPVDISEVAQHMDRMIRRLIGEDVRIVLRLDPAVRQTLADRGEVEQVLVNLAVNARDAMPAGGTLTIETANATLDEAYAKAHPEVKPGPYVVLAVGDTGVGMSDEVLAHLFEPFFTTKDPGKGTGLGLATCYGIARQRRGHIDVESQVGVGTTVRVYLPALPAVRAPASRPAPRLQAPGGHESILVVEDEKDVRRMAVRILKDQGYTVYDAADGEEAVAFLKASAAQIDLLLTDVVLPGIGGREVADAAARLRPGLRVLFTSGYSADYVLQRRILDHEATLLPKPFTPEALARRVREVIDRSPAG